jgi:hypothetical protein
MLSQRNPGKLQSTNNRFLGCDSYCFGFHFPLVIVLKRSSSLEEETEAKGESEVHFVFSFANFDF